MRRAARSGRDGSPEVLEAEGDLVRDPPEDDLVLRILEERRHGAGELGGAGAARVAAVDLDPALEAAAVEVRDEPGERAQQRRLPGAGGPEQGDDLAGFDPERNVSEGRRRLRVREGQVFDAH